MCGVLGGANMTRRQFFVIDLMVFVANTNVADQTKGDAKRWYGQCR